MSFFKDFKEDLSQAVNELMPEESAEAKEEVQMVDTLTEDTPADENSEPSIEEMLNNIDSINVDAAEEDETVVPEEVNEPIVEPEEATLEETVEPEEIAETEAIAEPEPVIEPEPVPEPEPVVETRASYTYEEPAAVADDKASDETGLVTAGMSIKGDITTAGSLEILGSVEGDIDVKGKLEVAGTIKGNSKAADIYAESALITGELISSGPVKIGLNSIIKGNIAAKAAVIAGAVKGDIDVQGPVILDTTAIIMGNIKSKSIQINTGAVVEGMCSQCYADQNANTFFEDDKKSAKSKK